MKKKNDLNSILNEINKYNKLIKESYVFDEEDNIQDADELLSNDDEAMEMNNSESVEDKINNIRSIALEGIQEFAKEVDSDEYNIFKNIWMTCDKFYSSKNKENEEIK